MKDGKSSRRTALAGLASRLRMVQAECADQSDALRVQCLDDEISQTLQDVLPQDRAAFLEDLRSFFPAWHAQDNGAAPAAVAAVPAAAVPLDAEAVVKLLAQMGATLPDDKKQQIARHLAKFGYVVPNPATVPVGAGSLVKEMFGITSNDPLDVPRVFETLALLAEFSVDLDDVVWQTWKQIALVNSSVRREMDLKRVMSAYILGDPSSPKTKVVKGVEALRRLIAALTASIPQSWRTASSEARKICPEEVEKAVIAEGGRGVFNFEKRCWQKYKDLSDGSKPNSEGPIRKAIAEEVERWMKMKSE